MPCSWLGYRNCRGGTAADANNTLDHHAAQHPSLPDRSKQRLGGILETMYLNMTPLTSHQHQTDPTNPAQAENSLAIHLSCYSQS